MVTGDWRTKSVCYRRVEIVILNTLRRSLCFRSGNEEDVYFIVLCAGRSSQILRHTGSLVYFVSMNRSSSTPEYMRISAATH